MAAMRERFHFLAPGRGDYGIDLDPYHTDWAGMGLLRDLGFNDVTLLDGGMQAWEAAGLLTAVEFT